MFAHKFFSRYTGYVDNPLPYIVYINTVVSQVSAHAHLNITRNFGMEVVLCVSVCVCYHASCYIPGLYDTNKVSLGFLRHVQGTCMHYVDFVGNASFKSSGDIY